MIFNEISSFVKMVPFRICMNSYKNHQDELKGCDGGVVSKVLDWDIVVSEFKLQLHYYVHFLTNTLGKRISSLIHPAIG